MAGTKNGVLVGKNADFSQDIGPNAQSGESNGLITNGQLWIGRTAVNTGGTHIDVNTLTAGAGVTITNGPGTITVGLSGGAAAIEKITGDSGSVTGNEVFFKANTSNGNAGATVSFVASTATEMNLKVTDSLLNTLVGQFSGNASLATAGASNHGFGYATLFHLTTGTFNTALGYSCLTSLTTGSRNVAVGHSTLGAGIGFTDNTLVGYSAGDSMLTAGIQNTGIGSDVLGGITTGTNNTAIGYRAGISLASSESSNIVIGNSGTIGDNNKLRIGTQGTSAGQVNNTFIAGIVGVTVSNPVSVVINSSTGEMGTTGAILSSWTDVTGPTQTLAVGNGYITDRGAGVSYSLPATASVGDVLKIDGKLGLTTIAQNANQAIRMGSSLSSTGVGGSVAGTNVGDCITLRCTTGGASTIWIAENWVGNWTIV